MKGDSRHHLLGRARPPYEAPGAGHYAALGPYVIGNIRSKMPLNSLFQMDLMLLVTKERIYRTPPVCATLSHPISALITNHVEWNERTDYL